MTPQPTADSTRANAEEPLCLSRRVEADPDKFKAVLAIHHECLRANFVPSRQPTFTVGCNIVFVKASQNVGVDMIRDLDSVVKRENVEIGVLLTLTPPTRNMIAEAAAAGQHAEPGFHPVPRLQIVTIEEALSLRDRAVELPARRDDAFKRAAPEADPGAQTTLDL